MFTQSVLMINVVIDTVNIRDPSFFPYPSHTVRPSRTDFVPPFVSFSPVTCQLGKGEIFVRTCANQTWYLLFVLTHISGFAFPAKKFLPKSTPIDPPKAPDNDRSEQVDWFFDIEILFYYLRTCCEAIKSLVEILAHLNAGENGMPNIE